MRLVVSWLLAFAALAVPQIARANLTNDEGIHRHVDAVVARLDLSALTPEQEQALLADRLSLSLGALVPVLGSYRLDTQVYGEVRPAAIAFDWVLGGAVPLGLGATALATRGALDSRTRAALGLGALGLYALTRIAVEVIGNLHISEYNRTLAQRLDAGRATPPAVGAISG